MGHDVLLIMIGVPLTAGVTWLLSIATTGLALRKTVERLERLFLEADRKLRKRVTRVERYIPTSARALLVILRIHLHEETNGDVKQALDGLDAVATGLMVSQPDTNEKEEDDE